MSVQGLELLVTVLLARNRQPTVAADGPHAELAAELITLPSGLLAMVCEAIVQLRVRLGRCLRPRGRLHGRRQRAGEVPAHARRLPEYRGQGSPLGVVGMYAECWKYSEEYWTGAVQVSDVVRPRRNAEPTGPLRRSSRLSTLRAGGSA